MESTGPGAFDLSGRTALVTGGGRGIGRAVAVGLASAGADVAIVDRDLSEVDSARAEIEAMGRRCVLLDADLLSADACETVVEQAVERLGGLTILVNNVGTNIRLALDDVGESDWDAVVDLNLKSFFFVTRAAGKAMRQAGYGKVVNMASLMALSVFSNPHGQTYGPYSASKGGVISLTRSFAVEWAIDGVRVNAVCPAFVDTELTRPLREDPLVSSAIAGRTPMGRFARIDEVVGPVIFLAAPASDFVTGTTLLVDGGWYAA
jgi:NAD(P)-dependent dehydrogenase (short-subunit alcohol dehydrogenase family)